MFKLFTDCATRFIPEKSMKVLLGEAHEAMELLLSGKGKGADMRGWIDLPLYVDDVIKECNEIASSWAGKLDAVVVIGIGGSYLGAKCALKALSHTFSLGGMKPKPVIVFGGYSLSEDYMSDLLGYLKDKEFGVIVISKSGTTTEPAIAFRILKKVMLERFGPEVTRERIVAVTDGEKGALREMCKKYGYRSLAVPNAVGGRYSVLSSVGLLPIAMAGCDIRRFVEGAKDAMNVLLNDKSDENPVIQYAAIRNALYRQGKKIEVFVNYNPKLKYLGEWLKQLFAESEGKETKGLFPASLDLTTDLHSVGQYIQDGERTMFETAILAGSREVEVKIPEAEDNLDGLDYLKGRTLEEINSKAETGTRLAHVSGGVPNIYLKIDKVDEWNMGQLFYFFELSCAVSAYILGVNPFDQPGVDVYKNELYRLLGRPGYTD
ncbi:MAG: glucose-6-phosphate isomerase [Candidatus Egerieousia sp.]